MKYSREEQDQALMQEFNRNASNFFMSTNLQRQELYTAYEYRDCHQWDGEEAAKRKSRDKAITVINLAAPLIRAVSGTECMQDKKIDLVPIDDQFDAETDIMGDAIGYAQQVSGYDSEQSLAREDAATCGIGATVTYLDMTQKDAIAGVPMVERIFPGFIGYDNSGRGAQINKKARWCFYADPVNSAKLDEYIESKLEGKRTEPPIGAGDFKAFLMSFSRQENQYQIEFVYHYFWWEFDTIYDVANPFLEQGKELGALMMQDPDVANLIGDVADKLKIDWQAGYWSLDPESFKEFKNAIETVSLLVDTELPEVEYSKRRGKCYYRAEFARGMLLSRSRSYTQSGHPLNFITGYYDEVEGVYYGMMRPLSFVQDALNMSVSEFLGYAKSAAHGGSAYLQGSGKAMEAFERIRKEKAHEDSLTPLPEGANVIPKSLPATPQVLVEFIRLMMEVMPRVLGLGQEFLGVITTGDMTDSLYGKVMKQSFAVLANFANNSAGYSMRQGEIFIDIIRLMADANDGMILPILSPGHEGAQYIRLRKQNLASAYATRIAERDMTTDERQETFKMLTQLAPQFQQAGVNILPILTRYSNLDAQDKKELVELSTPKPQQPDPLNQELLKSQIRLGNAQAVKLETDAAEKQRTLNLAAPETQSVIEKNLAQAFKYQKDAQNTQGANA